MEVSDQPQVSASLSLRKNPSTYWVCGWEVSQPVWKFCRVTILITLSWLTYFYIYYYEFLYSYYDIYILLEKVIVSQILRQVPTFYGTQRFVTVCYLSLSWATSIQSTPSHPISWISILLPSMPRSSTCLLSFRFPHQSSFVLEVLIWINLYANIQILYTDTTHTASVRLFCTEIEVISM
jgi:hypothetical protein